jgi:hypothetical protein
LRQSQLATERIPHQLAATLAAATGGAGQLPFQSLVEADRNQRFLHVIQCSTPFFTAQARVNYTMEIEGVDPLAL